MSGQCYCCAAQILAKRGWFCTKRAAQRKAHLYAFPAATLRAACAAMLLARQHACTGAFSSRDACACCACLQLLCSSMFTHAACLSWFGPMQAHAFTLSCSPKWKCAYASHSSSCASRLLLWRREVSSVIAPTKSRFSSRSSRSGSFLSPSLGCSSAEGAGDAVQPES